MKTAIPKTAMATAIVLLVAAVFLAGCTQPGQPTEQELQKVRFASVTWIGYAPIYLANEKGFFEEQGLDVEIMVVNDIGAFKASFMRDEFDIIGYVADAMAFDAPKGFDGKIFGIYDFSHGADGILTREDIDSIADLRGKRIGYLEGWPSHFFLLYLLKQNGLSSDDIISINLEPDKAGAAFLAGELDAAVSYEPWLSKARSVGNGKVLITSKEAPGLIVDTFVAESDFLENNPEAVKGFMRAYLDAVEYYEAHPEESAEIMAEAYGLSAEEFLEMDMGIRRPGLVEQKGFFGTSNVPGQMYVLVDAAGEIWLEEGLIDFKVDASELVDSTIISELEQ